MGSSLLCTAPAQLTAVTPHMQTMLGSWDKHLGAGPHLSSRLAQSVAINGIANSYMVRSYCKWTLCWDLQCTCSSRAWLQGNAGRLSLVSASIACLSVRNCCVVLLTATFAAVA